MTVVETETTQENVQNWLQLDEGDAGVHFLTEEEITAMIFFLFIFITTISLKFSYIFSKFVFISFASLIRMTPLPPS
jgi:hypothetical protein